MPLRGNHLVSGLCFSGRACLELFGGWLLLEPCHPDGVDDIGQHLESNAIAVVGVHKGTLADVLHAWGIGAFAQELNGFVKARSFASGNLGKELAGVG